MDAIAKQRPSVTPAWVRLTIQRENLNTPKGAFTGCTWESEPADVPTHWTEDQLADMASADPDFAKGLRVVIEQTTFALTNEDGVTAETLPPQISVRGPAGSLNTAEARHLAAALLAQAARFDALFSGGQL